MLGREPIRPHQLGLVRGPARCRGAAHGRGPLQPAAGPPAGSYDRPRLVVVREGSGGKRVDYLRARPFGPAS
ncbi:hypothetical protein ACU686_44625 [Yinghuangia aomiensis]